MNETTEFQYIRQRDIGEILTASFEYIRRHKQEMIQIVAALLIPVGLLSGLAAYIAKTDYYSLMAIIEDDPSNMMQMLYSIMQNIGLLYLALAFGFLMTVGTTIEFIRHTMNNKNEIITPAILLNSVVRQAGKLSLIVISGYFLLAIGLLFCIIPGIYFFPVVSLVVPIYLFENQLLISAFKRAFVLIQHAWWSTAATILLATIMGSLVYYIFEIPNSLLFLFKGASSVFQEMEGGQEAFWIDAISAILSMISYCVYYIVTAWVYLVIVLQYFSLRHEKDAEELFQSIDNIGSTPQLQ